MGYPHDLGNLHVLKLVFPDVPPYHNLARRKTSPPSSSSFTNLRSPISAAQCKTDAPWLLALTLPTYFTSRSARRTSWVLTAVCRSASIVSLPGWEGHTPVVHLQTIKIQNASLSFHHLKMCFEIKVFGFLLPANKEFNGKQWVVAIHFFALPYFQTNPFLWMIYNL